MKPATPSSPTGPAWSANRTAAGLCLLCALSYAVAGASFFADPSTAFVPGTLAYWTALAASTPARQVFLLSFACAGLLAFCALGEAMRLIGAGDGRVRLATALGRLGFGATAVTYFRLLGGEAQRAAAYASGSDAVRQAIASFSLSIDPGGYLVFGASGLSLLLLGSASWSRATVPRGVAALGLAAGLLYLLAFVARLAGQMPAVDIAAGLGGIVVGPLWWLGLARGFLSLDDHGRAAP